jgi:hypothetical protein
MTTLFEAPTAETVDPEKDYFSELVGEGKKFRDEKTLARSKVESDLFIKRLQEEMSGLRQELNTRMTLEQYMEKIKDSPPPNPNQNTNSGNEGDAPLSLEKIEQIVEKKAQELAGRRIQEQNVLQVQEALKAHYGNDYVPKLEEATQSLGLSKEFMSNLAKEQPKAFLKLLGVGDKPNNPMKSDSGIFTPPQSNQTFRPSGNTKNYAYYQNIKKTDPKTYWSASVQNEMHKSAMELQESFYS